MTTLNPALLKKVELFSRLTDDDLNALVPTLTARSIPAGTVLFNQGDPGDSLFVITEGRFRVLAKANQNARKSITQTAEIAEVGAGEVVGELACIDPAPRSATVGATSDAVVVELNRTILDSLASYAPQLAMKIIGSIVQRVTMRLRATNQRIESILTTRYGQSARAAGSAQSTLESKGKPIQRNQISFDALTKKKNLSAEDLDLLCSQAKLLSFDGGQVLCAEGAKGNSCFFIAEGNVQICRKVNGQERILANLPSGSVVGQLALVDREERSATVRAMGNAKVIELATDVFENLMAAGSNFAVRFQKEISIAGIRQLRSATERLASMPSGQVRSTPPTHSSNPKMARPPSGGKSSNNEGNVLAMSYMGAALGEWDVSLEELEQITVVKPDGIVTQAELKARRMR